MAVQEGGVRLKNPFLKKLWAGIGETWRERSAEKRAAAATRPGADPHVARSRLQAALDARLAVRAGVRIDDFLRHRLARYAARLPVPLETLPIVVDIEAGEAVIRSKPAPPKKHGGPDPAPSPFAEALVQRDGPYAAREIRDAEAALDALDARVAAARDRIGSASREFADALASGAIVARPDLDATPEQLGRPPIPPQAPEAALRTFVGALLAAEAWRFSATVLGASGIPSGSLDAALRAQPIPVALGLVFAIGAAAAVFAFAGVAFAKGSAALADATPPRRRVLLALTSAGAALVALGVAAAASAPERWANVALLVSVPFAAALMWRAAGRLQAARAAAADAALAWDRERAREAVDRGRRVEILQRADAELQQLEAERAALRRRLQALQRRAIDADRRATFLARAEARRLDRLSEGLACALELDRYLFLRLASERGQAPVARPVRAGRLEPAVAPERLGITG